MPKANYYGWKNKPGTREWALEFKSWLRKYLITSPAFPRFCQIMGVPPALTPQEIKMLQRRYQKQLKGISMSNLKSCTHIKVDGVRCGSPALRGQQFCYFHQRIVRGVRLPHGPRIHPLAQIEDEQSIQVALMEVLNAIARNTIDLKRAALLLRGLHIAVKNIRNVRFGVHSDMVREVPEYQNVPETPSSPDQAEVEEPYQIPYSEQVLIQQYEMERVAREKYTEQLKETRAREAARAEIARQNAQQAPQAAAASATVNPAQAKPAPPGATAATVKPPILGPTPANSAGIRAQRKPPAKALPAPEPAAQAQKAG